MLTLVFVEYMSPLSSLFDVRWPSNASNIKASSFISLQQPQKIALRKHTTPTAADGRRNARLRMKIVTYGYSSISTLISSAVQQKELNMTKTRHGFTHGKVVQSYKVQEDAGKLTDSTKGLCSTVLKLCVTLLVSRRSYDMKKISLLREPSYERVHSNWLFHDVHQCRKIRHAK